MGKSMLAMAIRLFLTRNKCLSTMMSHTPAITRTKIHSWRMQSLRPPNLCSLPAVLQHRAGMGWWWHLWACIEQSLGKNATRAIISLHDILVLDLHLISPVSATTVVYFLS